MKWLEERPLVGLAIVVGLILCGEGIVGERMDTRIESIALPRVEVPEVPARDYGPGNANKLAVHWGYSCATPCLD